MTTTQSSPLTSLYHELVPLLEFLKTFSESKDLKFLFINDDISFKRLLRLTLVARNDDSPTPPIITKLTTTPDRLKIPQKELVHRAIEIIFEKNQLTNILTFGYRKMHSYSDNGGVKDILGVESIFPNTLVTFLKTREWELLLSRIGENFMFYLLLHTSMFLELSNGSFMQICGVAAYHALSHKTYTAPLKDNLKLERSDVLTTYTCNKKKNSSNINNNYKHKVNNIESKYAQPTDTITIFNSNNDNNKKDKHDKPYRKKKNRLGSAQRKKLRKRRRSSLSSFEVLQQCPFHVEDQPFKRTADCLASDLLPGDNKRRAVQSKSNACVSNSKTTSLCGESVLNCPVKRTRIFYSHYRTVTLSKTHALHESMDRTGTADGLITAVFGFGSVLKATGCHRMRRRYRLLRPLFQTIKRNFHAAQTSLLFSRIITRTRRPDSAAASADSVFPQEELKWLQLPPSPAYNSDNDKEVGQRGSCDFQEGFPPDDSGFREVYVSKEELPETEVLRLVGQFSSHADVSRFLYLSIMQIVPFHVFGCAHNAKRLFQEISRFVSFRRHEKYHVSSLLKGFRLSEAKWLKINPAASGGSPLELQLRKELCTKFFSWLFESLVIPLIQCYFYVTEHAGFKWRTVYYPKHVWNRLHELELSRLKATTLCQLDARALSMQSNNSVSCSYLRFMPKPNGVRTIVNMSRTVSLVQSIFYYSVKLCFRWQKPLRPEEIRRKMFSINSQLSNAFHILRHEKAKSGRSATLFKLDDIHCRIYRFARQWQTCDRKLPLYFVSVDIRTAFDCIPHDKLLTLVRNLLRENDYMIRKYAVLTRCNGFIRRDFKKTVFCPNEITTFTEFSKSLSLHVKKAVLIDQVAFLLQQRGEVLRLVGKHVKENVMKIRHEFYLQKVGVAQGSVLSTLFCSLFLDEFEKSRGIHVPERKGVLVRYVDDYLLITSERALANDFLIKMHREVPGDEVKLNTEKTLVNFDASLNGRTLNHSRIEHGDFFPWCGYLFCTKTLNVIRDFKKLSVADNMNISLYNFPGLRMQQKLLLFLGRKCSSLVLDCSLNSIQIVLLNVYQIFLYVACQLCVYASRLDFINVSHLQKTSRTIIASLAHVAKARISSARAGTGSSRFLLKRASVIWLGNHAFHRILKRKHAQFRAILISFKRNLKRLERLVDVGLLAAVTESKLNNVFKNINLNW
ncbi:telomerase reverse transcriptase-like isoform X2 [Zophobas morio]|uniref:telomerase reverse transcriptase-like isoform X2 n=1 Tax=Zophobas morio TaxID=2755281 RepID=UPI00308390F0